MVAVRYASLAVQLPDSRQLRFQLRHADRLDHPADRDARIVGPEYAKVLILVVSETHSLAVDLAQRRAVREISAPGQEGIAEVELLHQTVLRFPDLGGDFARGLEDGA